MKLKTIAAAAALLALPAVSQAGEVAGFTTSGYVDFSFQHNDRDDTPSSAITIGGIGNDDEFTLNQVALKLAKTPASGFGAVVEVTLGEQTFWIAPNTAPGELALTQGYVQYSSGPITVMGGKLLTILGSEVFQSPYNAQATRSILWGLQPLSMTGVRGSAKLGDAFTATVGVINEVNGNTTDTNDQKALELQVALAASGLNAMLTHYATSESAADVINASAPLVPTALTDLVLGFTTGGLSLGLNADIFTYDDAVDSEITGFALYAGYQFTPMFKLSGRFETVNFEDNTGLDVDQNEITLTGGFACDKDFDLLLEARMDELDTTPASTAFDGDDSGNTFVVKGIYKF